MFDRVLKILLALKREHHHLHHQRSGCDPAALDIFLDEVDESNPVNPTGNTPPGTRERPTYTTFQSLQSLSLPSGSDYSLFLIG
jgi:hypothetical protein